MARVTNQPKAQPEQYLRYRVSILGGGKRRFSDLDRAVKFAQKQSAASWAQEDWTVWDLQHDSGEPTCVLLVAADGTAWDPFAKAVEL